MRADLSAQLGSIKWSLAPLWSVAPRVDNKNVGVSETNLLSLSYGRVVRKDIDTIGGLRPESYATYNIIEPGDIVLRMTDLQNDQRSIRTGQTAERGIITSAYITVRPDTRKVEPRFLAAVLRAYDIQKTYYKMGAGVRQNLGYPEFTDLPVPTPDLPTQQRIADYLDRETGEIDAMIAKMDELAGQLAARRTEMIRAAFDSEVIPCAPTPLFAIASSEDYRRVPLKAEDRGKMSGDFPYYGASGVIDHLNQYIWDNETRVLISEDGANLLARNHPIAFIAAGQYWVNNHAHVLRPNADVDPRLICFAMSVTDIQHAVSGSAQPKLTADAMWRLKVSFPLSHSDSATLADRLDEVTGKIDAMLAKVAELKSLLTERRAAVITDVVTGRKDVA